MSPSNPKLLQSKRFKLGLGLFVLSCAMGWPAVALFGSAALAMETPALAVYGSGGSYALSCLLLAASAALGGGQITVASKAWIRRKLGRI